MSITQVQHKGKTIVYIDYRGLTKTEQQLQVLEELNNLISTLKPPILTIANFEGITVGTDFMNKVKEWGKANEAITGRQAVLGVTGLKSILFQGYLTFTGEKNMKTFDNESEAMDWVVG